MSVISVSSTAGLLLNASLSNPIDINPGVTITNATGDAVAASVYAWTIVNSGAVSATAGNGFALTGGALTNSAGGSIAGGSTAAGVYVRGSTETITNDATIRGDNGIYDVRGDGAVTNASGAGIYGTINSVVFYLGTGTVVNSGLIDGQFYGIFLHGGGGWVSNTTLGIIDGADCGISFRGGTSITTATVDNAGVVTGGVGVRLDFINTVVNTGYIGGGTSNGIDLEGSSSETSGATSIITNDVSGRIKGYLSGVDLDNFNQTLVNSGHITGVHSYGVRLGEAGVITNAASGTIAGYANAVEIFRTFTGAAGTVVNDGSITSQNGAVVVLVDGGTVTNAAGGTMTGQYGVVIGGKVGTIVNDGFIGATRHEGMELIYGGLALNGTSGRVQDSFTGIFLRGDGTVINQGGVVAQTGQGIDTYKGLVTITNAAGAYVNGTIGVNLASGGTLVNAGDITGSGGTAVAFAGFGQNRLAMAPGAHFQGNVIGSSSANNTLELLSAASGGVLNGIGTQIVNFGAIAFDPGAQWQISGNTAGFAGAITGFAPGDTIVITGITVTGTQYFGGVLTLQNGADLVPVTISGYFAGEHLAVTNILGGAEISLACFARGTRICTPRGEVGVEDLRAGDLVMVHAGDGCLSPQPVVWTGHRAIDCRGHADARLVWPVRIAAGAFGEGMPVRDLWLSPDHAVFVAGGLVPVRHLINGGPIAQITCDEVEYFHVELAKHGVLVADGLPAESYLDTGNRSAFANGGGTECQAPPPLMIDRPDTHRRGHLRSGTGSTARRPAGDALHAGEQLRLRRAAAAARLCSR